MLQVLPGHRNGIPRKLSVQYSHLQDGESGAGVPVGKFRDHGQKLRFHLYLLTAEAPGIPEGPVKKLHQLFGLQALEHEDPAAGQESPVDLKGRVFRGGADEDDAALFHKGQEGVLLGLVEAMDLVHEDDGPLSIALILLRLLHDGADLPDAAGDGGEIDEGSFGAACNDPGQGGLSHTGRPPEDHGGDVVLFNETPQDLPLSQKVLLSHEFLQGSGPKPGCQGL